VVVGLGGEGAGYVALGVFWPILAKDGQMEWQIEGMD